ncbi:hypothetical protein D3C77_617150 [compost metagenome]
MIINDVFTTLGSANINTRSMQVDSELNIAHEWGGGKGAQEDPEAAFNAWQELLKENKTRQGDKRVPDASIIEFNYEKPKLSNLD